MRYPWNRHHLYIANIVFLNNLVQKHTFLYFAFSSSLGKKGSSLGRVSLDRLCRSQRDGTTFLTMCATADLNFQGGWPFVQVNFILFSLSFSLSIEVFYQYGNNTIHHSMGIIQCITSKAESISSKGISRVTGVYGTKILRNAFEIPMQKYEEQWICSGFESVEVEKVQSTDRIFPDISDILWIYGNFF